MQALLRAHRLAVTLFGIAALLVLVAALAVANLAAPGAARDPTGSPRSTATPAARSPVSTPTTAPVPAMPTASPSQAPTSGWPFLRESGRMLPPVIGDDGTIYTADRPIGIGANTNLFALATDGSVRPGWPVTLARQDPVHLGLTPDGDLLALACDFGSLREEGRCALHRLGPDGAEDAGWPALMDGDCYHPPVISGSVTYLLCTSHDRAGVWAFDAQGATPPGWPVAAGQYAALVTGPDGTLYVRSSTDRSASITVLAADGSVRPGWPISVGVENGVLMGDDGLLRAWEYLGIPPDAQVADAPRCVLATQTRLWVLNADGSAVEGWPRTIDGNASAPALGPDGVMYLSVAPTTGGSAVLALDARGAALPGWPRAADGLFGGCFADSPRIGGDGSIILMLGSSIVRLDAAGEDVPGWPYRGDGRVSQPCVELGPPPIPEPVVGPDGTLYYARFLTDAAGDLERVEVGAITADGILREGWPFTVAPTAEIPVSSLGCAAGEYIVAEVVTMMLHPNGSLLVLVDVTEYAGGGGNWSALWLLTPDGKVGR